MDYNTETTVVEFVDMQKKKGLFEESAEGFKTVITAEDLRPSAQDLINEVGLNPCSPSFFKNTRAMGESGYYDYVFARGRE